MRSTVRALNVLMQAKQSHRLASFISDWPTDAYNVNN